MPTNEALIKNELESTYDLPFRVTASSENNEIEYFIFPENPGQELFGIRVTIRNGIRLIMDFIPEKYSANFIRSLAVAPLSGKQLFINYANLMKSQGAKVSVRINESELCMDSSELWPPLWNSCTIRINKIVVNDVQNDPVLIISQWSKLFIGMILSLASVVSTDDIDQGYAEGHKSTATTNRYERNRLNRNLCLIANGYSCKICGFNFEQKYGVIGHNFIHVHHIVPVSQLGENYIINPREDLIPVCPNCHAMLHRKDPPYLPIELIEIISQ